MPPAVTTTDTSGQAAAVPAQPGERPYGLARSWLSEEY